MGLCILWNMTVDILRGAGPDGLISGEIYAKVLRYGVEISSCYSQDYRMNERIQSEIGQTQLIRLGETGPKRFYAYELVKAINSSGQQSEHVAIELYGKRDNSNLALAFLVLEEFRMRVWRI